MIWRSWLGYMLAWLTTQVIAQKTEWGERALKRLAVLIVDEQETRRRCS